MSDHCCPECDYGFPASDGRTDVEPPWKNQEIAWYIRVMRVLNDAILGRRYVVIQCPNCGHIVGEDRYDGNVREELDLYDDSQCEGIE